MKDKLSKKDVLWSYLSKAFSILSGLITLPLILRMLSEEEIAINYLFLNLISYTILFDMGFSPQFSRNIGFAFGGSQEIKSVGYIETDQLSCVNYKLIKNIINAAQYLYFRITLLVFGVYSTIGTWYVLKMTNEYGIQDTVIWMWAVFVILETIDFYYKFYTPLLQGKGAIAELNQIEFFTSLLKIVVTIVLLLGGLRLWAVLIGIFVKTLSNRLMSVYVLYFKDGLRNKLRNINIAVEEKKDVIRKMWYNSRRSAIVQISSFCNSQLGFLFAGICLSAAELSSYGLLIQLVNIFYGMALSLSNSITPIYAQLRANGNIVGVQKNFYFTTGMYYVVYILGSLFLIFVCPYLLDIIKSNAVLPHISIVLIYLIYKFLEGQHCICIFCLSSKNKIFDTESAVIMAIGTISALYIGTNYFQIGLIHIVLIQFVIAFVYANWKWPYELCRDFHISYFQMIRYSFCEVIQVTVSKIIK